MPVKAQFMMAVGVAGGVIVSLLGGWDTALMTLVIFMGVDYLTGLIVAGLFHTSQKTENGRLESRAVVIAFIANETISIIENAGLMGVPIPAAIIDAIEVLKKQAESRKN